MKLSKTKQQQLDTAYDTLIQVCLYDSPLQDMEPYLADDVMNFGAGKKELTKTKSAFIKQIENQKKLAAGLKMKFHFTPVLRKITSNGNGAIYTDDIINTVWVNGVKNRLKFRLSFIFEYRNKRWVMVHSHTSSPDSQRQDDEIWPVEELKKRTALLEKSLDEKIAELQIKNRELEIEAALEKVRSRSLAMHKSKDLEIVITILLQQLEDVGILLDTASIVIPSKDKKTSVDWTASKKYKYSKGFSVPFLENGKPALSGEINRDIVAALKSGKEFTKSYSKKEKNKYYQNLFDKSGFSETPEARKEFLLRLPGISVSTAGSKNSYIQIFSYSGEELSAVDLAVLKRFAMVFEQCYIRFQDLEKAEAQAREAQIEAALERVRSRSLAMHKSDELQEVVNTVFERLKDLNISMNSASIFIFKEGSKDWEQWVATSTTNYSNFFHIPYTDLQIFRDLEDAKQQGKEFYEAHYPFQEKNTWFEYAFKHTEYSRIPDDRKKFIRESQCLILSFALGKKTALQIAKYSGKFFSDDEDDIVKRFSKVFEQVYIRFLDLQKAEAQAREAQIEAALEKVRSCSLAMHSAEELQDVVTIVGEKLQELGVILDSGGVVICTYFPDSKDVLHWTASFDASHPSIPYYLPYFDTPIWKETRASKYGDSGDDFFEKVFSYEDKNHFFKYALEHSDYKNLPDEYKKALLEAESHALSFAWQTNSALMIASHTGMLLPEEHKTILKRFSKVFEQAYIRFMDLQKAEAQAREAQIDAALEKVRSRSLVMHKSDEMQSVANAVYEQLNELGIVMDGVGMSGAIESKKDYDVWIGGSSFDKPLRVSFNESTQVQRDYNEMIEKRAELFTRTYSGDAKIEYTDQLLSYGVFPDDLKKRILESEAFSTSIAFSKNSAIQISRYTDQPYSDKENEILKRFATVFEQAYIRFMDLQKAEAQSRESQIQLALERVRARTMAMHKSDELAETAAVLFQQMTELGVTPERLNICLIKEETKILEVWSTDQKGIKINHHFDASLDEPTTGKRVYDAWKEKKKSLIIDLSGQELNDWLRYVREVMGMTIKEELVKEHRVHSVAFFSHGMVLTTTPEPFPEESMHLLERFADVFNLTYRRFLDLKQAEAQARESQIEASLERVRAKAMAMNNSSDLTETVRLLFQELNSLDLTPVRCGLGVFNKFLPEAEIWATTKGENGIVLNTGGKLLFKGHHVLEDIYESWKDQKEFHAVMQGDDLKNYGEVVRSQVPTPDWVKGLNRYDAIFPFPQGAIYVVDTKPSTDEELVIYRKFTSVMALTYQRYEDIKESEARALEAIKKSSLDRVRAEIASMRSTEDLNRITPIIWRELKTLEVPFFRCGVFIVDEDKAKVQVYLTTPDGKSLGVLNLAFDSNKLTNNTVEFWRRKEVYKEHWNKEEFINWSKSMLELGQIKSQQEYQGAEKPPESLDLHFIPFEQGMLYVGNKEPLTSEKIDLVKSLAEAFSIAYARYEDFDRLETAKKEVESAFGELDLLSKELKIKNEELETENQRKAKELEDARQLQLSMLPRELPQVNNLDIAVYMKTATEVGGDYYDFYIQPDGTLNVLVGDATGHGMMSGMMVSIMKSFFIANRNNFELKHFFENSNISIKDMQLGRLMMACIGVQITPQKVIATNAGMPSLLYFRNKSQKAGEFVINNMPLGAMKGSIYSLKAINYEKGDTLLLMSDGFAELKNENEEQYGYTRVKEEFKSVVQKSSDEIIDHLKNSATEWANGVEPDDDLTLVVIKVK